jgi:hypothetical protein
MVSPPNFDHGKLDVYRVRESASGLAAPFEHEDESKNPREKTRNPTIVVVAGRFDIVSPKGLFDQGHQTRFFVKTSTVARES